MQGYFITFEGPDGAGKTTVINEVVKAIQGQCKREILVTREPGGSKIAEKIRDIILDPANTEMNAKTEALLYAASRSQHVSEIINPALKRGDLVISDRFVDSSLAYQGQGRRLGIDEVAQINAFATGHLEPDLTIFLDLDPAQGLARIAKVRSGSEDRLEQEKLAFHEEVYRGYQKVNQAHPDRVKVVDASQDLPQVVAASVKLVKSTFPELF
ncbi:dTMP kinase [Lactobacillus delbrueckii]|uniref:dTMP kinase n=1 Tax=Lactobacillus delbrueckii TaxID=1584 RepID=UPI001107F5AD|nr:dTMP kinase [Lactobacillus delbrueckii]MCD5436595.1 dTMP kinase [Lactobacillus delbrueckii subsp. lactis]MCD5537530.1 dTMP kinase [Lactobacillus delbrueckii subsp. lactis]MCD5542596.1 dTMP kinase [Lactobacillus delbrueckii subsp. lactis]MDD1332223.1 dTMP kinase [Lactobacillus delbrueckii subsp. lactis]TLQ29883.1 dTMP kinase [Lactobacillus delbrueckii subsp. lactis]